MLLLSIMIALKCARHHCLQLKQLFVDVLELVRCAHLRNLVHHTLRHINQVLLRCRLDSVSLRLLLLDLLQLRFELCVDVMQYGDLSLLLSNVRGY